MMPARFTGSGPQPAVHVRVLGSLESASQPSLVTILGRPATDHAAYALNSYNASGLCHAAMQRCSYSTPHTPFDVRACSRKQTTVGGWRLQQLLLLARRLALPSLLLSILPALHLVFTLPVALQSTYPSLSHPSLV